MLSGALFPSARLNASRVTPEVVTLRNGSKLREANCVRTPPDTLPALANSPAGMGANDEAEPVAVSGAANNAAEPGADTATRIWIAADETSTDEPAVRPASCDPARLFTTEKTEPRTAVSTAPASAAPTMDDSASATAKLVPLVTGTPRSPPAVETNCRIVKAAAAPASEIWLELATSDETVSAALSTAALELALVADAETAASSDARTSAAALALPFRALLGSFSAAAS